MSWNTASPKWTLVHIQAMLAKDKRWFKRLLFPEGRWTVESIRNSHKLDRNTHFIIEENVLLLLLLRKVIPWRGGWRSSELDCSGTNGTLSAEWTSPRISVWATFKLLGRIHGMFFSLTAVRPKSMLLCRKQTLQRFIFLMDWKLKEL